MKQLPLSIQDNFGLIVAIYVVYQFLNCINILMNHTHALLERILPAL